MKLKSLSLALIAAGVVATGAANAVGWNPIGWFDKKQTTSQTSAVQNSAPGTAAPASAPIGPVTAPNYRAIVEQYGPAVVGINTQGVAKTAARGAPDAIPDEMRRFFRGMPGFNGQMPRNEAPTRGVGSGFIISKDGLILTNAHVVDEADEVTVKLSDRREYRAKVLGSDPATDVAVLKIDAKDLPVVSLGHPSGIGVGDYVLAIGSPFGFEQSATAGIVSAKGRSLPGDGYVPFIQTDVAVNPGNSGGPLFDTGGNVVGINSQIYSRSGGYQGVSFAIPIDVALRVKDQIVTTGKVSHARLGVSIQELDQSLAESFKLQQPNGALVSSVMPGSAAAKAGIESGDVILSFNSQPIGRSGDLPAMVGAAKPGDKTTLEVWRAGKKIEVPVVLAEAKEQLAANDADDGVRQGRLGVAVRPLTGEEKAAANVASGVVVEQSGGRAARAGIEAGDIIVSVNGTPVKSVEQLQAFVSKANKHLALLIQRDGSKIFVPVPLG